MNIKVHRTIQKVYQMELAEHLGISQTTLSKYENNIGYMPTRLLVETAKFLKTTPNELLQEYMEEENNKVIGIDNPKRNAEAK